MDFAGQALDWFRSYGAAGLFVLSFLESFISPILPDLLLIPMALAAPGEAIYYSMVATGASVLGGFVGYGIGNKLGIPALKKIVPPHHTEKIRFWLTKYGGFAIFLLALAPIPYKFTSIAAGAFRINMPVFVIASLIGRGKRFLLEGILISMYGPRAAELIDQYSNEALLVLLAIVVLAVVGMRFLKSGKKTAPAAKRYP